MCRELIARDIAREKERIHTIPEVAMLLGQYQLALISFRSGRESENVLVKRFNEYIIEFTKQLPDIERAIYAKWANADYPTIR